MIRNLRRLVGGAAVAMTVVSTGLAMPASAATPPFIAVDADWLTVVNYFRDMSGLNPVSEDASLSVGAKQHSCYMLQNGISHDEVPGNPGYTAEGDAAGNSGNVAVSSVFNEKSRSHIELWMTGPFHAIGVLRPNLRTVGYGKCDSSTTPKWHSGATLDVLHGLSGSGAITSPILFPGDGSTTSLSKFITESPNPLDTCGWTNTPAGLPIIALMPEGFSAQPTATVSGSGGAMQTCVLSSKNTTGVAQSILAGNNAVIVIPRSPLGPDTYAVSVSTTGRTVNWTFTVDPTAATGVQPVPVTTAVISGTSLVPLAPSRVVDTRIGLGSSKLITNLQRRIQIVGHGGVPSGAKAISGNFTVTGSTTGGYLTVWNCSADRPVVSTLNFAPGETVPNGASVPLDANGGICVFANTNADLLLDVNGYYAVNGTGKFSSIAPTRLMDSRIGLGAPGRLSADSLTVLPVTGVAGVPTGATMVALNVTSVSPSADGFVTVYPCGTDRPVVSSLNPVPDRIKPNLVMTPVAADGTVCIYSLTDVDIVVDITGFVSTGAADKFTPSSPFRLTDTRDRNRPELQAGTNGGPVQEDQTIEIQVAGTRGIAADAQSVSANITVIGGTGPGFVTAWPCGPRPLTSVLNYAPMDAIANGGQLPLSADGKLCLFVSTNVHVILDINGWWS